jgi:hypothetical protein
MMATVWNEQARGVPDVTGEIVASVVEDDARHGTNAPLDVPRDGEPSEKENEGGGEERLGALGQLSPVPPAPFVRCHVSNRSERPLRSADSGGVYRPPRA